MAWPAWGSAAAAVTGAAWVASIAPMSWPMPPWPMSAIVSTGRGSRSGTGARSPARAASVPAAKPVRSIACAKIVKASWPDGLDDHVEGLGDGDAELVDRHRTHGQAVGGHDGHLQPGNPHVEVGHRRTR